MTETPEIPEEAAVQALHAERHAGRRCTMAELCPAYRDVSRDIAVLAAAGVLQPSEAETKALAETTFELGRALGRKEAGEEIAAAIEGMLVGLLDSFGARSAAAAKAREYASQPSGAASKPLTAPSGHTDLPEGREHQ